jgi:hypothetical protein
MPSRNQFSRKIILLSTTVPSPKSLHAGYNPEAEIPRSFTAVIAQVARSGKGRASFEVFSRKFPSIPGQTEVVTSTSTMVTMVTVDSGGHDGCVVTVVWCSHSGDSGDSGDTDDTDDTDDTGDSGDSGDIKWRQLCWQ